MRSRIIIFFLALSALAASAQVEEDTLSISTNNYNTGGLLLIGYLSYDAVLQSMALYDSVQAAMATLRAQYEQEMKRVEDEFNKKYETFLEERPQYPRTILLKRQQELQDMLQHNVDFKNASRRELAQAEQQALAPLRIHLNEAIATVARQRGLVVVLNTDSEACPFIEPSVSINVEAEVREAINSQ